MKRTDNQDMVDSSIIDEQFGDDSAEESDEDEAFTAEDADAEAAMSSSSDDDDDEDFAGESSGEEVRD